MKSPIIIALDTNSIDKAHEIITQTEDFVWGYKIGHQLLYSNVFSPKLEEIIKSINNLFIDLKFHDIPNTVEEAVLSLISINPKMITVHASGGREMIKRAAYGRERGWPNPGTGPKIIAVTILTSFSTQSWMQTFAKLDPSTAFETFLNESINHGADGIVCSGLEVSYVKKRYPSITTIVPGIRLTETNDDQARAVTPKQAIMRGADYIVVGRPITASDKPRSAVIDIVASL